MNRYELYAELQEARKRIEELEATIARQMVQRPSPPMPSERRLPPLWKQNPKCAVSESLMNVSTIFKQETSYDITEIGVEPDALKALSRELGGKVLYNPDAGYLSSEIQIYTFCGPIRIRAWAR